MIYGLIPVGGKGLRLGLPFSKEMLPQKNYDFYNPLINHTVEKMFLAGVDLIYMVHGTEYKNDIVEFYKKDSRIIHLLQDEPSFAGVFDTLYNDLYNTRILQYDQILFGLPDSIYDGNPFLEMLTIPGIVCGMFSSDDNIKVDRPLIEFPGIFDVKAEKNPTNMGQFWGVLKLDINNLERIAYRSRIISEVGTILSECNKTYITCKDYVDLGTWVGYNKYISNTKAFSNTEFEKKYDASNINVDDFLKQFNENYYTYLNVSDTKDYYFSNNNQNIEFIRYRDGGSGKVERKANITIKNFNTSQLNRFELTIPVDIKHEDIESILQFMSLMGAKFEFSVEVNSHIFSDDNSIIVMYSFRLGNKEIKLIEIELKNTDFKLLSNIEKHLSHSLPGFDPNATIKTSKFRIIKDYHDKNRS